MKALAFHYRKTIIAAIIGALVGYTYNALIGRSGGSCMISSNPFISGIYGLAMGMLAVGSPQTRKSKQVICHE